MLFVLSKLLLFFTKPLIWVFITVITAILIKNKRRSKWLFLIALSMLYVFSNGFIVGKIMNAYEAPYPKEENYEVGIVLGGFSGYNKRNQSIEFGGAGDRLFQAIKLYKTGKIKYLLLSSGNANLIDNAVKEANLAKDYLLQIGIPDSSIWIENNSRNTLENAKFSLALIRQKKSKGKIVVISSAWHIPRVKMIFSRFTNQQIAYYPTAFSGGIDYDFGDIIFPSASALVTWDILIKEWIGLIADRMR